MAQRKEAGGAVLIAGPTASGKSGLALAVAERRGGVVINADALQVYAELRILTARPSPEEERAVPHRLYGHVRAAERYSVGRWIAEMREALAEAREAGRLPVIVGGTGLYFKALTKGLAPVPAIPETVRTNLRERLAGEGPAALHGELAVRDPVGAARVRPSDPARILRALEVVEATGRPLSDWHREPGGTPLVELGEAEAVVLDPPRERLAEAIRARLRAMVAAGAVEEARTFAALGLDPSASAAKALGLRPFMEYAAGRLGLAEALEAAAVETSQYAKRQTTWFRNQMGAWPRAATADEAGERLGGR
ncbi:MAG: tRNA (adenosine(37)-N6)-dimethylallyltransferase MiaA [Bauldia sp.]|nr:tRNA (adenosine(37)-N6)-dimethylallyltransferase MiaA [Bauldia sp.]